MRQLTRESALWLALALFAGATRLIGIDTLLSDPEARVALPALAAAQGLQAMPGMAGAPLLNPLFGFLQYVLFSLFGASGVTARLVPALAGCALCLLPALFRGRIRRSRALMLGFLLALSPTLMFVARQATGATLAWALAACVVWTWPRTHNMRAVALGLLLACGTDALLPLIVLLALRVLAGPSLAHTGRAGLGRQLVIAGLACALGATGLFLRPPGLADVFNGLAAWLQGWTSPVLFAPGRLLLGLLGTEVLLLIFGAVALIRPVTWRDDALLGALILTGCGLLATVLYPARSPASLVPLVCGLALLASGPLDKLARVALLRIPPAGWAIGAASFLMFVFAGLAIRLYAEQPTGALLTAPLIALILVSAMVIAAVLNGEMPAGVFGAGSALAAVLLLHTSGWGFQLASNRAANPAEPYIAGAPTEGLAALADTVRMSALRATGDPTTLRFAVDESAPPALRWALRDQNRALYGRNPGALQAVLLPDGVKPEGARPFIGSGFDIVQTGDLGRVTCSATPSGPDCGPLARWLAFRTLEPGATKATRWTLWLSAELASQVSGQR